MKNKKQKTFIPKINFDYEEDNYDKLLYIEKNKVDFFTNKAKMKKAEYDYEEDAYEPETDEN